LSLGYGIVDISSSAFTTKSLQVHLINPSSNNRILIPPSASLIEVLFDNMLQGTSGTEKWKRINEIWSGGAIKLVISKESKTKSETESEKEIERDNKILADKAVNTTPTLTPTTATLTTSTITSTVSDNRVKLALNLLNLIPFKSSNDHLSSKLSKELDSPLLIAVNGISLHWIQTAQSYHFLYPFPLRLNLMKSVCMGRLRALWILQQRTSNSVELNSIVTLPRRKFRIHRDQFLQCMKKVFKSDNRGDLRLFEFEYAEELGTGHGPTMEFYALASQTISSISSVSNNGLFPCWKKINDLEDQDWFRIIGSFVSRAWLDDRIIDVPINPIFLQSLLDQDLSLKFDNLKDIDQELYNSLKSNHNLIESDLNFLIPGTEICLLPRDKEIRTFEDAEEFKRLLLGRINERMIKGRDSFLQGFNQSFPCSFHDCIKYFTDSEVSRLFSQSLNSENSSDWTLSTVLSALVPDHGYTLASPQIRWLSEMIAETEGYDARGRLVRFLTGAAYLPIGGWKALRPPLTIVCKSDDVNVNASGMSNANSSIASSSSSSSNIAHNTLPTTSPTISSDSANHDYYLPSVMTCANYLKLPRYSSKEVMEEKFQYAIKEGSDSFHLS
jgi:E3 ubiquitin-protein ligase TRIP12